MQNSYGFLYPGAKAMRAGVEAVIPRLLSRRHAVCGRDGPRQLGELPRRRHAPELEAARSLGRLRRRTIGAGLGVGPACVPRPEDKIIEIYAEY
jgi:hypothetical protein